MSNKKLCHKTLLIGEERVAFGRAQVYALVGGSVKRIRHYRSLPGGYRLEGVPVIALPADASPDQWELREALDEYGWDQFSSAGVADAYPSLAGVLAYGATHDTLPRPRIPQGRVLTGEGGWGFQRTPLEELHVLAVNNRAADSFYENAATRAARQRNLVAALTTSSPDELYDLVVAARDEHQMRTSSISMAVDAIVAGHPRGRALLSHILQRPDEPGLALRYYLDTYRTGDAASKGLPQALRKAVADGAARMYSEQSALDFDVKRTRSVDGGLAEGQTSNVVTFRDVLRLTHPTPPAGREALFAHLAGRETTPGSLPLIEAHAALQAQSTEERQATLAEAHAQASSILTAGYARAQIDHPLGKLSPRALAGWVPRSEEQIAVAQTAKAVRSRAREVREAHAEIVRAERRARTKLRRLSKHVTRADRWSYEPTHITTQVREAEAALQRVRSSEAWVSYSQERSLAGQEIAEARKRAEDARGMGREAWEVALVSMGYKETLSSLAALERAGVSEEARSYAAARLADPRAAQRSNAQLPDIISAAKATAGGTDAWLRNSTSSWDGALDGALQNLLGDVPEIPGRVLVLVDGSGSMGVEVTPRANDKRAKAFAQLRRDEVAATFGAILASRAEQADVVVYDHVGTHVELDDPRSPLRSARTLAAAASNGGTDTWRVMLESWDEHDTVVILTDEQSQWHPDQPWSSDSSWFYGRAGTPRIAQLPAHVQVVTCNLAGDAAAHDGGGRRFTTMAGVSQDLFTTVAESAARGLAARS